MTPRTAERRIIYSLVVILIAIQLAIFFVLRFNNARIARAALKPIAAHRLEHRHEFILDDHCMCFAIVSDEFDLRT